MGIISKPGEHQINQLTKIARQTFLESHAHSASKKDIENYLSENYTEKAILEDLKNPANTYKVISREDEIVGFSKVILNKPNNQISSQNVTKLERIYVLERYHGSGLGIELFSHNIELARKYNQKGMWLHTWVENHRAIGFYKKMKFKIIGNYDFKISENHSNPNYLMWLELA